MLADLGGFDFFFDAIVSGGFREKFLERGESHWNNLNVFSAMPTQENVAACCRPDWINLACRSGSLYRSSILFAMSVGSYGSK